MRDRLRITKLGGQRYALWIDDEYYASGCYGFVKQLKEEME